MLSAFEVKEQTALPVLSIRTHAAAEEIPQVLPKLYDKVMAYLNELGEEPAGAAFAAYYNMDMQHLDMEAGFITSKKLPAHGEIGDSTLRPSKYATCLYTGPYDGIPQAHNALHTWITEQGLELNGATYEVYWNDPAETAPANLQTEIRVLIK